MNSKIIVKEYKGEYQTQVLSLILHIQQKEYNIPITKNDQSDLLSIEDYYQTGNGNFWVAVYNDKVVGTISLLDIGNHQVALRKMFVDQGFRGAKYKTASLLLNEALFWAREKAIKAVFLGTTPQFLAAHRFYEKNGFQRIDQNGLPDTFEVMHVDKMFYKYLMNNDQKI